MIDENRDPLDEAAERMADINDAAKVYMPNGDGRRAEEWGPDPRRFSVDKWLGRELPLPHFLLGGLFSTTTRSELIGSTGIGKTNFAMDTMCAMASRSAFLHWKGHERDVPGTIVYFDGEMSARLAKERLRAMVERHGGAVPQNMVLINRHDYPKMPPLNTEGGQKFMNWVIERLGPVCFVCIDNIQAMTAGVIKEEETWKLLLPFLLDLTRRNIGQLWVHHTGHDASHGYGTKTVEWQMDTVMQMTDRRQDGGPTVDFDLEFTKARERTPANIVDFTKAHIWLENDRWQSTITPAFRAGPGKVSPKGQKVYAALVEVISSFSEFKRAGDEAARVTTRDDWRKRLIDRGLISDQASSRNQAAMMSKYISELSAANWIIVEGDKIWVIRPKDDWLNCTVV